MEELQRAMRAKGISVEDLRRFEARLIAESIAEHVAAGTARSGGPADLAQDLLDGTWCYLLFPDEEFLEQILGRHGSKWLREQACERIVASRRDLFQLVRKTSGCAPA